MRLLHALLAAFAVGAQQDGKLFGQCRAKNHHHSHRQTFEVPSSLASGSFTCDTGVNLIKFGISDATSTCCPADSLKCAGCQEYKDNECTSCSADYQKQSDGTCLKCNENYDFVDVQGLTCHDYGSLGLCKDGAVVENNVANNVFNLTSAASSCCVCGGGKKTGTPWAYKELSDGRTVKLGQSFSFKTFPRTAEKYGVNKDCDFGKYGIEVNGATGAISSSALTTNQKAKFTAKCKITAFQSDVVSYTVTVKIEVTKAVIVPTGSTNGNKLAVFDKENKATTFTVTGSNTISGATITCNPGPILSITDAGVISLSSTYQSDYESIFTTLGGVKNSKAKKFPGIKVYADEMKHFQSLCVVSFKDGTEELTMPVFVIAVQPTQPVIAYNKPTINLYPGRPKLPIVKPAATHKDVFPITPACSIDGTTLLDYSHMTGYVTYKGMNVVNINSTTGEISGTPSIQLLESLLYRNDLTQKAVTCQLYTKSYFAGIFYEDVKDIEVVVKGPSLTFNVFDSSCWIPLSDYTQKEVGGQTWVPVKGSQFASSDCKHACARNSSCTGYITESSACYELAFSPATSNPTVATTGTLRIPDCIRYKTCIDLSVTGQYWMGGRYCPMFPGNESAVVPLLVNEGGNAESTYYLRPYSAVLAANEGLSGCSDATYLLQSHLTADGVCEDSEWKDASGNKCADYVSNNWCKDGILTDSTKRSTGAAAHCCECGKRSIYPDDNVDPAENITEIHGKILGCVKIDTDRTVQHHHMSGDEAMLSKHVSATFTLAPGVDAKEHERRHHHSKSVSDPVEAAATLTPLTKHCPSPYDDSNTQYTTETGNTGEDKPKPRDTFQFGDPYTALTSDYSLHPCECFGEAWGQNYPVTSESFQDAQSGSDFNKLQLSVKLFRGQYRCAPGNREFYHASRLNASNIENNSYGGSYTEIYFDSSRQMRTRALFELADSTTDSSSDAIYMDKGDYVISVIYTRDSSVDKFTKAVITTKEGKTFTKKWSDYKDSSYDIRESSYGTVVDDPPWLNFSSADVTAIGTALTGGTRLAQVELSQEGHGSARGVLEEGNGGGTFALVGTQAISFDKVKFSTGGYDAENPTTECTCDSGRRLIGGSCKNRDGSWWNFGIANTYPNNAFTWSCKSDESERNTLAHCVCASGLSDDATVIVEDTTSSLDSAATCPSGHSLLMGGCKGETEWEKVTSSVPATNGWQCTATDTKVTAYAICLKDRNIVAINAPDGKQVKMVTISGSDATGVYENTPALETKPDGTALLDSQIITAATGKTCSQLCEGNKQCHFYAVIDVATSKRCELYSECGTLVKYSPDPYTSTIYGMIRSSEDSICRIADPKKCWERTKRRAFLTGRSVINNGKKFKWNALIEQCETLRLLGGKVESCAFPSYYKASDQTTQMTRIAAPANFPHGARVSVKCAEDRFSLVKRSATNNAKLTCANGVWRDSFGSAGLTTHTCASCVHVSGSDRSGLSSMISMERESLFFLSRANFSVTPFSDSKIVGPELGMTIYGDNLAISYNEGKKCLNFTVGAAVDCPSTLDSSMLSSFEGLYPFFQKNTFFESAGSVMLNAPGNLDALPFENKVCNEGIYMQGECFFVENSKLSWDDAEAACVAKGGHLAGIHDEDQYRTVADLITTGTTYWVGLLRDQNDTSAFIWADGHRSTLKSWNEGEPNNQGNEEGCGQLSSSGNWNDAKCTEETNYVCGTPPANIVFACERSWISTFSSTTASKKHNCVGVRSFNWNTVPKTTIVYGDSELACPSGMALSTMEVRLRSAAEYTKDEWTMIGECHYAPGLSEETRVVMDISSTGNLFSGDGGCPAGMVIHKVSITGGKTNPAASLFCVFIASGMSYNMAYDSSKNAKVMQATAGSASDGLYCPTHFDDTGRLSFTQEQTYKGGADVSSTPLAYKKTNGKWCIGASCSSEKGALHPLELSYSLSTPEKHFSPVEDLLGNHLPTGDTKIGKVSKGKGQAPPYPKLVKFTPSKPAYSKVCFQPDGTRTTPEQMGRAGVPDKDPCYAVAANMDGSYAAFTEDPYTNEEQPELPVGFSDISKISDILTKRKKEKAKTPGIGYQTPYECLNREAARATRDANNDLQNEIFEERIGDAADGASLICNMVVDPSAGFAWGGETDFKMPMGDICKEGFEMAGAAATRAAARSNAHEVWERSIRDGSDCNSAMYAYSRIVCDVNCALDAVVAGNKATSDNLQMVYDGLNTNNEMLQQYWGTLLGQKIDAINGGGGHHHRAGVMGGLDELGDIVDDFIASESVEKLMKSARDRQPHLDGAKIFHHAHDEITTEWDALKRKIEEASSEDLDSKSLLSLVKQTSDRLKKHTSFAHHRLSKVLNEESVDKIDDMYLRGKAVDLMEGVMTESLNIHSLQYSRRDAFIEAQNEKSTRLAEAAESMVGSKQATALGAINFKLDKVSSQIEELGAKLEDNSLRSLIANLNEISSVLLSDVGEYVFASNALHSHHRKALESLEEYFNCGTDDNSVRSVYSASHSLIEQATSALMAALPKAEASLRKAHGVFIGRSFLPIATDFAVRHAMMGDASHHRTHAEKWLSQSGVEDVYGKIASAIDGTPWDISSQLDSMFKTSSFLVGADTYTLPRNDSVVKRHGASVARMMEELNDHHHRFVSSISKSAKHGGSLILNALEHALPEISPVPPTCQELAFTEHAESRTAGLVLLGHAKGSEASSFLEKAAMNTSSLDLGRNLKAKKHHARRRHRHHEPVSYVMTVQPELLLDMPSKNWEAKLSKGFDFESSDLPMQTIHSTYVCSRDNKGTWSVTRAVDMPDSQPVVLCGHSAGCDGFQFGSATSEKGIEKIQKSKLVKGWAAY